MTVLPALSGSWRVHAPQRILLMGRDLDQWRMILAHFTQPGEKGDLSLFHVDEKSWNEEDLRTFQVALLDYETLSPFQLRMVPALKQKMPHAPVLMCVATQNVDRVLGSFGNALDDWVIKDKGYERLLPERIRWVCRKTVKGQDFLNQSLQFFQEAQRMQALGIFASGIAHDFNNVLSMIFGHTQMALMALPQDSPVRSHLAQSLTAGNRAKELVKEIFTISRHEKGGAQKVQAGMVIKEAVKFLKAAIPSTINIHQNLKLQPTGWDTVLCDASHIYQILLNLCTNAVNAIGSDQYGSLTIEFFPHEVSPQGEGTPGSPAPGRYAALKVSDDGRGIPGELMNRIFDPQFTTMDDGKSAGMGLTIVKELVEDLKGSISIQSQVGRGTVVTVLLPCVAMMSSVRASDDGGSIPTGTERVLFVDDEEMLVQVGELMLRKLGYEVAGFGDSREALKTFEAEPEAFDLVLTDLTMPNLSGFDLVRKCLEVRPDLPIIVCTGCGDSGTLERLKEAGVRGFLRKPFIIKLMAQTIREALD